MANYAPFYLEYRGERLTKLQFKVLVFLWVRPDSSPADTDVFEVQALREAESQLLQYSMIEMSDSVTKEMHDAGNITWHLSDRGEEYMKRVLAVDLPRARIVWTPYEEKTDG